MKKFVKKTIPSGASHEEQQKIENENARNGLKVIGENLEEIRAIFKVQLDKFGHAYRQTAVEEIIKYLYQNRADKVLDESESWHVQWDYLYAKTLYDIADIIQAVNKGDVEAFVKAMENLPWGDSNTGDQISWNCSRFAYGIMSDEAREQFGDLFLGFIARSNVGHENPVECVEKMANLDFLPSLIEHNLEEGKKITAKKPGQPGDE